MILMLSAELSLVLVKANPSINNILCMEGVKRAKGKSRQRRKMDSDYRY